MFKEQGIEGIQDFGMAHLGGHGDTKRLAGVFIDDGEHLIAPAAAQFVVNEVDTPDVVWMPGPQTNDRAVLVVKPFAPFVAMWQLKAFFPP